MLLLFASQTLVGCLYMDMDVSLPVQPCVDIMLELYTLVLANPGLVSLEKLLAVFLP